MTSDNKKSNRPDEEETATEPDPGLPARETEPYLPAVAGANALHVTGEILIAEDRSTKVSVEESGRYKVESIHGSGGQAKVFLAVDEFLGREIALKELLVVPEGEVAVAGQTPSGSGTMAEARFLREARVTGQLEHPNIVPVYELGRRENGALYYTMRLVRGKTLSKALSACRSLPERLHLLPHFVDLCNAMAYAHSRGVIHRDLKPGNVMVGEFGETVLLDWGLAKVRGVKDEKLELERQSRLLQAAGVGETVAGMALGTPSYMSPEQAQGRVEEIDERSDVWGLGAVLYRLLTGRAPVEGNDAQTCIVNAAKGEVRPVKVVFPEAPAELAAVAEKALRTEPGQRYQSAKELSAEVRAYLTGKRVLAHEYTSWELLRRFASRNKVTISVAAVAAVLLLALGVFAYLRVVAERDRAQEQRGQAMKFANLLVGDLFEKIEPLAGSTPALDSLVKPTLEYYQAHVDPSASPVGERLALAVVYQKVGDVALAFGKTKEAREAQEASKGLLEALVAQDPGDPEKRVELSKTYSKLGVLAEKEKSLEQAHLFFQKALEVVTNLPEQVASDAKVLRQISTVEGWLGDLFLTEGKLADARSFFKRRLELATQLAKTDPPDPQSPQHLSESYDQMAQLAEAEGKSGEAREFRIQQLSIDEKVAAADPTNSSAQRNLFVSYNRLGRLAITEGKLKDARVLYDKMLSIAEKLAAADPANAGRQHDLAGAYHHLVILLEEEGDVAEARRTYEKVIKIAERLVAADPTNTGRLEDLAGSYGTMADLTQAVGDLDSARVYCEKGLADLSQLVASDPANVDWQQELANFLLAIGDLTFASGKPAEARNYYERARKIMKKLLDLGRGGAMNEWLLSYCLVRLGDAAAFYATIEALYKQDPTARYLSDLLESAVLAGKYQRAVEVGPLAVHQNGETGPTPVILLAFLSVAEALEGNSSGAVEHAREAAAAAGKLSGPLSRNAWSFIPDRINLAKLKHPLAGAVQALMAEFDHWTRGGTAAEAAEALQRFGKAVERRAGKGGR